MMRIGGYMGATRMNITLPEDVVKILKKKTKSGEKSAFIADAIRFYAKNESQEDLMKRMIEGYKATYELSEEDKEWLDVENEY
jgi:metal-responsive CopG/Arc/MetJ family transcriptional regulator